MCKGRTETISSFTKISKVLLHFLHSTSESQCALFSINAPHTEQFAPFAALRGFEEIVRKQEILYEQRKMLSEEQKCGLDRKLQMVSVGMKIQATYFKESREMKPAGQYHTICGTVEFFDPSIHLRIDDTIILIPDLCELSGDIFEELELPC